MAPKQLNNDGHIHPCSMGLLKMILEPDENEHILLRDGRELLDSAKSTTDRAFTMAERVYSLFRLFPPSVSYPPEPDDTRLTFEVSDYSFPYQQALTSHKSRSLKEWSIVFSDAGAEIVVAKGPSPPPRIYDVANSVRDRYDLMFLVVGTWWWRQGYPPPPKNRQHVKSAPMKATRPTSVKYNPMLIKALENSMEQKKARPNHSASDSE